MTDKELVQQISREIREANQEPVIHFTLERGEPGLTESKTGGTPYLPRDLAWPLGGEGLPMTLLAQVDCRALQGLPDFPHTGLLQFFIGLNDVFGLDFNDMTNQNGFRVLYHETVDPSVTAEEVQAKRPPIPEDVEPSYMTPLGEAARICFGTPGVERMTDADYRFEELFCAKWNERRPDAPIQHTWDLSCFYSDESDEDDEDEDREDGYAEGGMHQMGGYPYFTQTDPRWGGEYPDLDVVLFQLDSDMQGRRDLVLWGDCGIGNFFINRQALRRKDFSRVGYSWDCC